MTQGIRARVRAETTEAIKETARRHLAVDGPNLSLRAVARELGVASSAVYRYFASRDELLTALIIDAYNELGDAVETAEAAAPRRDLAARFRATGHGARNWARAHPHEYGLTYGTPVPGYAAPQDTTGPATRPVLVLMNILRDGVARGSVHHSDRLAAPVRADLEAALATLEYTDVPPAVLARGMIAWTELYGALNFELFGRLIGAINDYDAWFDHQLRSLSGYLGLPAR
jgi:AcrR family transcriptional regulator